MLYDPQYAVEVGLFLVGLAVSATLGIFFALWQAPQSRMSLLFTFALAAVYLPLATIGVQALPLGIAPTVGTAWTILGLMTFALLSVHALIVVILAMRGQRSSIRSAPVSASVHFSSSEYHDDIVAAERLATDLAHIQIRVAPYFLSRAAAQTISSLRFGEGDESSAHYVKSHAERQDAFNGILSRKVRVREIYQRDRLLDYVRNGTHSAKLWPLPPELVVESLSNWRRAILDHENYHVAISDEQVPLKYHLIDRSLIYFHEPIRRGEKHRLNSLVIRDANLGDAFATDFDFVWSQVEIERRDSVRIGDWIDRVLIPLARKRK